MVSFGGVLRWDERHGGGFWDAGDFLFLNFSDDYISMFSLWKLTEPSTYIYISANILYFNESKNSTKL